MKTDFKQLEHDIIAQLDIAVEAESLGIQFTAREPNADGWLECRAFDRQDAKPSAAVNVESKNGSLGRYRDLGPGGQSLSFFDLAAALGKFADWRVARDHYAERTGVELPRRGGKRQTKTTASKPQAKVKPKSKTAAGKSRGLAVDTLAEKDDVFTTKFAAILAKKKLGVTVAAIEAAGGRAVDWPANAPSGKQLYALAFNAFRPSDWTKPVAILLIRETGETFPAGPANKPRERKTHLIRGSRCGLVVVGGHAMLTVAETVWLCEGLPDALSFHRHLPAGHVAVTCSHGAEKFNPEIAEAFRGKRVFIVYDADKAGEAGAAKIATALVGIAIDVRRVRLPYEVEEKHGKDLRDFLNEGNGFDELSRLAESAEIAAGEQAEEDDQRDDAAADLEPSDEAAAFLAEHQHDGVGTFRFWQNAWWRWQGGQYIEQSAAEIRAMLMKRLSARFRKLKSHITSDVVDHLKSQAILPDRTQAPAWIEPPPIRDDATAWPIDDAMMARNMIVHLPSFTKAPGRFAIPPTPRLFSLSALDYDFDPYAPEPTAWLKFLDQLWPGDQSSIELLQAWFGYCLTADTRQHKILVMIGPPRSGKGTITRILKSLLSPGNTVDPTLDSFGDKFGLWALRGKTLAVVSDMRLDPKTSKAKVVEQVLAISGEDDRTFDVKFEKHVTCKIDARLMIVSNEIPRLLESSGALAGRMVLLRLTENFIGREDRTLGKKLSAERAGILLWAIEGWRKLRERGCFVQPQSGMELLSDIQDLSTPVGTFVQERCRVDAEAKVSRSDLYAAYREWATTNGQERIEDKGAFGQRLRAAFPELRDLQNRISGKPVRFYLGIALHQ